MREGSRARSIEVRRLTGFGSDGIQLTVLTTLTAADGKPRAVERDRYGPAASASLGAAVLDAARKLCFEGGPDGVTARRVAAEVGCTAPAIYRHYRGMEQILHALRMEGHGLLGAYLDAPPRDQPCVGRLAAMQDEYFRFGCEHPRYFGLMFPACLGAGATAGIGAEEAATLLIVRDEAARGIERGEIRTDLDPLVVANHCWLAVHSLTATHVSGHLAFTAPGLCEELLEQAKQATVAWLRAR